MCCLVPALATEPVQDVRELALTRGTAAGTVQQGAAPDAAQRRCIVAQCRLAAYGSSRPVLCSRWAAQVSTKPLYGAKKQSMNDQDDLYWRLRPPPPTPDEEMCVCAGSLPLVLQPHFSSNPLSCLRCNLEVSPERLALSEQLAEKTALWQRFYDAFFTLWLDSGEHESWARAQLEDPASPVNKRALELVGHLNEVRRTYYWWFQDTGAEDFEPLSHCPRCRLALAEIEGRLVCEQCSLVIAN